MQISQLTVWIPHFLMMLRIKNRQQFAFRFLRENLKCKIVYRRRTTMDKRAVTIGQLSDLRDLTNFTILLIQSGLRVQFDCADLLYYYIMRFKNYD